MGRGDGRSRRGKIFKGSYGNTRTHKVKKAVPASAKTTAPKATGAKKAPATKKAK
jgi:30S ribosomal protein S31